MSPASYTYNDNYFDGKNVRQMRPKKSAYKTYAMRDGTLIGLFQGNRGARPDLDFVIKVLLPGKDRKLAPPIHSQWIVDLMLKIPESRQEVRELVQYFIDYYDKTKPFTSIAERNTYVLETVSEVETKFGHIDQSYTLSLDAVATLIELFSKCEKQTPNAYMFKGLLTTLLDYIDGKKHYMDVISAAQPGFRR